MEKNVLLPSGNECIMLCLCENIVLNMFVFLMIIVKLLLNLLTGQRHANLQPCSCNMQNGLAVIIFRYCKVFPPWTLLNVNFHTMWRLNLKKSHKLKLDLISKAWSLKCEREFEFGITEGTTQGSGYPSLTSTSEFGNSFQLCSLCCFRCRTKDAKLRYEDK